MGTGRARADLAGLRPQHEGCTLFKATGSRSGICVRPEHRPSLIRVFDR